MWLLLLVLIVIALLYLSCPTHATINMRDVCQRVAKGGRPLHGHAAQSTHVVEPIPVDPSAMRRLYANDPPLFQADDELAYRMWDTPKHAKESIDNRAVFTKNMLVPFFEEELRDHGESIWWENDALEAEL